VSPPAKPGESRAFEGANGLKITLRVVKPQDQESDVQMLCFFKHKEGADKLLYAIKDLDEQLLGGLLSNLRGRGEFMGNELETLVITPPKGSIKAKKLLMIGLGDEDKLSADTMQRVGAVAMREAMRLGARRCAFGAAIRDQGNDKLPVGDVAGRVLQGAVLAYDTEKRLQKEGLSEVALEEWVHEAGPEYFYDTAKGVEMYVAKANDEVKSRSQEPYSKLKPAPK
jgi:hypothetical protein